MKEGDIVLALLPQTDGRGKYRPAVVLRRMPGFGDLLVCGVSTQLRQQVPEGARQQIFFGSHLPGGIAGLSIEVPHRRRFLPKKKASHRWPGMNTDKPNSRKTSARAQDECHRLAFPAICVHLWPILPMKKRWDEKFCRAPRLPISTMK